MSGLKIVILGLSITSSWGNGHATTYRGLVRELHRRGHEVTFLERDVPWYAASRDLPSPPFARTLLYADLAELQRIGEAPVAAADLVILGSYVPQGRAVAGFVLETAGGIVAFYDIDTPVTLAALARGDCEYLTQRLIPAFDLYLSFTGGPTLRLLERELGARMARPLYCAADPETHHPEPQPPRFDLGYLGTCSADRQPGLERLLLQPAWAWPEGRFAVAGSQYPETLVWPANVARIEHLPPDRHSAFYCAQRFTLNLTRSDMTAAGWSPSVRLFEAAACGTPIVSDWWEGLDEIFAPGKEILIAQTTDEACAILRGLPEKCRIAVGEAARARVLAAHTAAHRAVSLESHYRAALRARQGRIAKPIGQEQFRLCE